MQLLNRKKTVVSLCAVAFAAALLLHGSLFGLSVSEVHAAQNSNSDGEIDFLAEYESISYDSYDGLVSAEINAVAQTDDGYIWVGTYSGLYKYNGKSFEKSGVSRRIYNVMSLFVDSRGRLWVGTNDTGLVIYDPSDNSITHYDVKNGLPADSVRSMCEDEDGNVYVGTVSNLAVIDKNGEITVYDSEDDDNWENLLGIRSLSYVSEGRIIGVTNSGALFLSKSGRVLDVLYCEENGVYYIELRFPQTLPFPIAREQFHR